MRTCASFARAERLHLCRVEEHETLVGGIKPDPRHPLAWPERVDKLIAAALRQRELILAAAGEDELHDDSCRRRLAPALEPMLEPARLQATVQDVVDPAAEDERLAMTYSAPSSSCSECRRTQAHCSTLPT